MPDEKGNVTLEITLPQEIYDRVKRLAEDGVQDLFPMPMNRQPTTAEEFVAELLIGRLRAFGITEKDVVFPDRSKTWWRPRECPSSWIVVA